MNKRGSLFFVFGLLLIVLFSCFASAGTLQVTTEHPFLVDGEWISASSLEIGDELTLINGSKVKITSITEKVFEDNFSVYNLEALEYSDFVVNSGDGLDVVVHNSGHILPVAEGRAVLYHASNKLVLEYWKNFGIGSNKFKTYFAILEKSNSNLGEISEILLKTARRNTGQMGNPLHITRTNKKIIAPLMDTGKYSLIELEQLSLEPVIIRLSLPKSEVPKFIVGKYMAEGGGVSPRDPLTSEAVLITRLKQGEVQMFNVPPVGSSPMRAIKRFLVGESSPYDSFPL
ncbi:hypothetical protein FJZ17_03970 [Candidatus Pacearchaeota archaeon]|nr:hypothetical protein [Candidatus Pacearchaeota archaeon]